MAKRGSIEWRNNISKSRIGSIPWNKGGKKLQVGWNKGKKLHYEVWNKGKKGIQIAWNKGKSWNSEIKRKISKSKKGKPNFKTRESNHYRWKGSRVSYNGLHAWVTKYKNKPKKCEHCGTIKAKKYNWANVSGEYKRDLDDYIRLCKSCHNKFDRRVGGKNATNEGE